MAYGEKYSAEQRRALIDARLVDNLKLRVIAERAAAGTLKAGLAPFDISWRYVGQLAKEAARRQATVELVAAGPEAALLSVFDEVMADVHRVLRRNRRAQGKMTVIQQADATRAVLRLVREAEATRRALAARDGTAPARENAGTGERAGDYLAALAAQETQRAK